jgi:hypothetical protein
MIKSICFLRFAQCVFDEESVARQAAHILRAIVKARSPRLSDISQKMPGKAEAGYKRIQRFLAQADPQAALLRLFQVDAQFVLGDPTEIPRPQARKTEYVGKLKDGKTKGFWLMSLATPFRGRAIPFHFITYSSRTIAQQETSRNLDHCRAFEGIKALLGDRPLVLDREFSYLELLHNLVAEGVQFVIRLHMGSHPPIFVNQQGRRVELLIQPGQEVVHRDLFYKGEVRVQVIGRWKRGFARPLWVMTSLEPQQGLQIYLQRMKIDESFRDLKSLLGLCKVMNKSQHYMEQMVALLLLAYAIGILVGEAIRDHLYGPVLSQPQAGSVDRSAQQPVVETGKKWKLYSGLFILLKQKVPLPACLITQIVAEVLETFVPLVQCPVRTNV